MSIFPGPVPPETNPPIQPQNYKPSQFIISGITQGTTTTITTTKDNNYVIAQLVRVLIPYGYGCVQLSGQSAYVMEIPNPNQVVLDIDSTNYDTFNPSYTHNLTPPQIIAIGDVGNGTINSTGRIQNSTFIPGSFINISPQ